MFGTTLIGAVVGAQLHAWPGMGMMPAGSVLNSPTSVYTKMMPDSKRNSKTSRKKNGVGMWTPDLRGGGG